MQAEKTYRVYDNQTSTVQVVRASDVSAYERALWDEAERQAYRSDRRK